MKKVPCYKRTEPKVMMTKKKKRQMWEIYVGFQAHFLANDKRYHIVIFCALNGTISLLTYDKDGDYAFDKV